jgi:hypothetical protein
VDITTLAITSLTAALSSFAKGVAAGPENKEQGEELEIAPVRRYDGLGNAQKKGKHTHCRALRSPGPGHGADGMVSQAMLFKRGASPRSIAHQFDQVSPLQVPSIKGEELLYSLFLVA